MNRRGAIPLLARPQGGEGCVINKCRGATTAEAAGVVYLFLLNRKTTPSSRSAEASRHLIDRLATPPCGGARRGILLDSDSFTSSIRVRDLVFCAKPAQP